MNMKASLTKQKLIWLVPLLITVHNAEEAVLMPFVLAKRNAIIPQSSHGLLPVITYPQFLLAVFVMTALPYPIAYYAQRDPQRCGTAMFLLLSVQFMMFLNVFAHLWMAWLMAGYAHGVITAVTVMLPFSIFFFRRAVKENWASGTAWAFICATGLLFHQIGLPLIVTLSGKILKAV